jgi:hypothetical protein
VVFVWFEHFLLLSLAAPKIFIDVATALKSTKWRFSSLNHQNFESFSPVPKSPTNAGLICIKTLEPNMYLKIGHLL